MPYYYSYLLLPLEILGVHTKERHLLLLYIGILIFGLSLVDWADDYKPILKKIEKKAKKKYKRPKSFQIHLPIGRLFPLFNKY
jgi:hypothetical protein